MGAMLLLFAKIQSGFLEGIRGLDFFRTLTHLG